MNARMRNVVALKPSIETATISTASETSYVETVCTRTQSQIFGQLIFILASLLMSEGHYIYLIIQFTSSNCCSAMTIAGL